MTLSQAFDLIAPAAPFIVAGAQDRPPLPPPQHWVDLGCGSGLFTDALAELLPPGSSIHGIDKAPTLQEHHTDTGITIIPHKANFITDTLLLQDLDGILMANSLHYVKDKPALLQKLLPLLTPTATFLIVEYDTDISVPTWVPYPVSANALSTLFASIGYSHTQKLGVRPSAYGHAPLYAVLIHP